MTSLRPYLVGALAASLLLAVMSTGAYCQGITPDAYGIPAEFGMGTPTTTRQLGMGAPISCVADVQCSNPAFVPLLKDPQTGARLTMTNLDNGPTLTSFMGYHVQPLKPGRTGLQLLVLTVNTSDAPTTFPGLGTVNNSMSEDAFIVDYGRRLTDRFTAGLGVLGYERTTFALTPNLGLAQTIPPLVDLRSRAGLGLRAGMAYEWQPGDFAGVLYSYSENSVDASGSMMGVGAAQLPVTEFEFKSHQIAAGLSYHLRPDLLAVAEYRYGKTVNTVVESSTSSWHFGAEYRTRNGWAVRGGAANGSPTGGVGFANDRWRADYCYISDWNDHAVGQLFGGSETHSVQVGFNW